MSNWFSSIKIMHINDSVLASLFIICSLNLQFLFAHLRETKVCSHRMETLVKITQIIMDGCSKEIIYIELKTE